MTIIQRDDYRFCADIPATQAYYAAHGLCDCPCCRNFYAQVRTQFPKLDAFLRAFGADVARPDRISSSEEGANIEYFEVDYTICGRVEAMGQYEFDLPDAPPVSIAVHDGFVSPNEQAGDYFTFSVFGIQLPWALGEPIPTAQPRRRGNVLKQKLGRCFKASGKE